MLGSFVKGPTWFFSVDKTIQTKLPQTCVCKCCRQNVCWHLLCKLCWGICSELCALRAVCAHVCMSLLKKEFGKELYAKSAKELSVGSASCYYLLKSPQNWKDRGLCCVVLPLPSTRGMQTAYFLGGTECILGGSSWWWKERERADLSPLQPTSWVSCSYAVTDSLENWWAMEREGKALCSFSSHHSYEHANQFSGKINKHLFCSFFFSQSSSHLN